MIYRFSLNEATDALIAAMVEARPDVKDRFTHGELFFSGENEQVTEIGLLLTKEDDDSVE